MIGVFMPTRSTTWFGEVHGLSAGPATTNEDRDAARRMQARLYAETGATYEIGIDGTIDDPWVEISDYIAVWGPERRPLATLRLIPMTHRSLPTLLNRELCDEARERTEAVPHGQLGEIASLAVDPHGFPPLQVSAHLYRAMFQHAIINMPRAVWLASINSLLLRFMKGCMRIPLAEAGPSSCVEGLVAQPTIVDFQRYVADAPNRSPHTWRYMMRGLTSVEHRELLAANR